MAAGRPPAGLTAPKTPRASQAWRALPPLARWLPWCYVPIMVPLLFLIAAGPIARYTAATAAQLFAPQGYVKAVLGAQPLPAAIDVRCEMRERGDLK